MKLMIEINDIIPKNDHERYILSHGTPLQKGHWTSQNWRCSICDYIASDRRWKFCPNCGADMRGDDNGISD